MFLSSPNLRALPLLQEQLEWGEMEFGKMQAKTCGRELNIWGFKGFKERTEVRHSHTELQHLCPKL